MRGSVKRLARNADGRDIIVGDVHGCFTKLQYALQAIGFSPEAGDRLIMVGDLVDRGPESAWVVEWLGQPWVHAVQGNHEDMAIRWPDGNMEWGNYAANGGSWMIALDRETQLEVAATLAALPIAIELETEQGLVGVVHAECPTPVWRDFTAMLESLTLSGKRRRALLECAQWSRVRVEMGDTDPVEGVRAVVVGHTPMLKSITLGNTIYIDTMGWRTGTFTLLDASTLCPAGAV
ncbi:MULTISPECIES: metallophosphoesterase [unclassified Massilia]|uniref:metallophosphoesterase n=1 Tax=unclassified Massilia TaxID=2609279 RepID=UPI001781B4E1|nr:MULTISPECIES: metallophosphoesterase [unclassified Massilia]MBD8531543.1 metallophosphoesterase [Massilia sp. CFBP 13647]MBD8673661.1 metallophosphoesterase [Massilia sp. CFBP 13721]